MQIIYEDLGSNFLFSILKNEEIAQNLAYMLDFKIHQNLKIKPKKFCVEIANADITIAVVFQKDFESTEYEELKKKPNFHVVSFAQPWEQVFDFESITVKYIDKRALLFTTLSRSDYPKIVALRCFLFY
jgi:hypothetical protein